MKKILFLALTIFSFTSCYDEYVSDYEWTGVYFANQHNVRSVVVGENSSIEVGVMMSGVLRNDQNRLVNYRVNNDLVTNPLAILGFQTHIDAFVKNQFTTTGVTSLTAMPTDWYTLSNTESFTIPVGDHLGKIKVTFDMDKLLNAPKDTKLPYYILPLEITSAPSIDSIISLKATSLVGIKYESKLFGNYWHGGVTEVRNPDGSVKTTTSYYTAIPQAETRVYILSTKGIYTTETNKLGVGAGSIAITLNSDNTVQVAKAATSTVVVTDEGSSFNNAKLLQDRKIFLKYKYSNTDGTTTHVTDTLTFRNRFRDGVNEWRSENPADYK